MNLNDMKRTVSRFQIASLAVAVALIGQPVQAESESDLAKQLANPVAALISVPIDVDFDSNLGPSKDGDRTVVTLKPVVPFSLNDTWNLITRTIVPYVSLDDMTPLGDESGLSDTLASFFFSPKAPTAGGWIWGLGPVALLPTATEDVLGSEKWGLGPTGVALKQQGPWTYGMLANHVWSFAGDDKRADYNRSFLQPFISYTTPTATTFSLQTESTYDWESEEWTVPINFSVSQVVKVGSQLMQLKAGVRYWADAPEGAGPEDWGFKVGVVFLFPK